MTQYPVVNNNNDDNCNNKPQLTSAEIQIRMFYIYLLMRKIKEQELQIQLTKHAHKSHKEWQTHSV